MKKIITTLAGSCLALFLTTGRAPGQETLEEAWTAALSASRAVQADAEKIASERYKRQAATQARVPKVTGSSSYTATSERLIADVDVSGMTGKSGSYLQVPVLDKNFGSAAVTVTAPVYLGGKIAAMEEAQDRMTEAANYSRQETIAGLRYEVARAYFNVLLAEKLDEIARAAKESLDARLRDAENLLDQGLTTRSALLSVELAHASAEQTVYETECQLSTARAAYNRLLWRPLDQEVSLVEVELPNSEGVLEDRLAEALQRRPEIGRVRAQARALMASSKSERAERAPHVAVGASYGYLQNETLNPNDVAQATVGMTWTPFDGVSRAKERALQSESRAVDRQREELENAIRLQVKKAWNDAQAARRKIETAYAARDQADENLRLTAEQFREGISTWTEALDAQALWTKAHSNLYSAYYNALLAHFALEYAVGN